MPGLAPWSLQDVALSLPSLTQRCSDQEFQLARNREHPSRILTCLPDLGSRLEARDTDLNDGTNQASVEPIQQQGR